MKKLLLGILLPALFVVSCKKSSTTPSNSSNTTNNTTVQATSVAAYTVDGITDVVISSGNVGSYGTTLPIVLTYHDSVQQEVTVTLSGIPGFMEYGVQKYLGSSGYYLEPGPWKGVPTFSLPIFFDVNNNSHSYTAGTYPLTLTATGTTGGTRTFTFNLVCQ